MSKKTYITPSLKVRTLHIQNVLAGSLEQGQEGTSTDGNLSKQGNTDFDFDDEDTDNSWGYAW